MQRAPTLASGTPVALETKGTVRLARGTRQERLQEAARAEDGVEAAGRCTGAGGDGQSGAGVEGFGGFSHGIVFLVSI